MKNENFKELLVKLGLNPEGKVSLETLVHSSQAEIQELGHKMKMPASENVFPKELAQEEE